MTREKATRRKPRTDAAPTAAQPTIGVAVASAQTKLTFAETATGDRQALESLRANLSAVEIVGDHVWLAADETWHLERLTRGAHPDAYGSHQRLDLSAEFDLPGPDLETDIEGLCHDGKRLWVLGSHCLSRVGREKAEEKAKEKPPKNGSPLQAMKIKKRKKTMNRCFLACLRLEEPESEDAQPAVAGKAILPFTDTGNALLDAIAADDLIRPFLKLPAKDNGLDFEGIASDGERVFIGLRGPVLGGTALILELKIDVDEAEETLSLQKLESGERYALHGLDLSGCGVRDLAFRGKELLVLSAPTMPVDGIAAVSSWRVDGRAAGGGFVARADLATRLRLPGGAGGDYAEGMTLDADGRLLVVYDRPLVGPGRLPDAQSILADRFDLPRSQPKGRGPA